MSHFRISPVVSSLLGCDVTAWLGSLSAEDLVKMINNAYVNECPLISNHHARNSNLVHTSDPFGMLARAAQQPPPDLGPFMRTPNVRPMLAPQLLPRPAVREVHHTQDVQPMPRELRPVPRAAKRPRQASKPQAKRVKRVKRVKRAKRRKSTSPIPRIPSTFDASKCRQKNLRLLAVLVDNSTSHTKNTVSYGNATYKVEFSSRFFVRLACLSIPDQWPAEHRADFSWLMSRHKYVATLTTELLDRIITHKPCITSAAEDRAAAIAAQKWTPC